MLRKWRVAMRQGTQLLSKSTSSLVHVANGFAICAMGSSDMLQLRTCLIFSNGFNIAFNLLQKPPLWTPVAWACFFIMGHTVQIVRLLLARQPVQIPGDYSLLYERAFKPWGFSQQDFVKLITDVPPSHQSHQEGEYVAKQGDDVDCIHYLVEGQLAVEQDHVDLNVIQAGDGAWVGEFWGPHYDWAGREHKWRVSFRCVDRCKTMSISKRAFHEAFRGQGLPVELAAAKMQIHDLRSKLHTQQLHDHLQLYHTMLISFTASGHLTAENRSRLDKHRSLHPAAISEADHQRLLTGLGWTVEDYQRGFQWKVSPASIPEDYVQRGAQD